MAGMYKVHVNQPYFLLLFFVFGWIVLLYVMSRCPQYDDINTSCTRTCKTAQRVLSLCFLFGLLKPNTLIRSWQSDADSTRGDVSYTTNFYTLFWLLYCPPDLGLFSLYRTGELTIWVSSVFMWIHFILNRYRLYWKKNIRNSVFANDKTVGTSSGAMILLQQNKKRLGPEKKCHTRNYDSQ